MELHDDRVVITREGLLPTISHFNSGEAEIHFESLNRLRYKPAVGAQHGCVRFEPAGASRFNPTDDAHTVSSDADGAPNFERLPEEVPERAGLSEDAVVVEAGGEGATEDGEGEADDAPVGGEEADPAIQTLRERFAADRPRGVRGAAGDPAGRRVGGLSGRLSRRRGRAGGAGA